MLIKKNIIIFGTSARSLSNFRGDLVKSLSDKGLNVIICSSEPNSDDLDFFSNCKNVEYRSINLKRNGLNLFEDIRTLLNIFLLVRDAKPVFILAYGVKLVIWGGIASRFFNVDFFALITGLGFSFQGQSFKRRLLTSLVSFLYKTALKNSKAVIFQNKDNLSVFLEKNIIVKANAYIVNGSGVDVDKFNFTQMPKGDLQFLCVSRLLGEKGLREFSIAASIVRKKYPKSKFVLVGPEDSSPDAIPLSEVCSWADWVDYKGATNDVRGHINASQVFVLPSHHEGLPRSTLEAMSMGRAILTTDAIGCRETVLEGVNGFMVPVGMPIKLAEKMVFFIENSEITRIMGEESRKIVVNRFDVVKVNKDMLRILGIA